MINWLQEQQKRAPKRPKFIISPVPFVPSRLYDVNEPSGSDTWNAFPESRRKLLRAIIAHDIEGVVFLSGDYHASNVTEITLSNASIGRKRTLWSITSSGLFVPFARSSKQDYVQDSKMECDTFLIVNGWSMDYKVQALGPKGKPEEIIEYDNFAYIDVSSGPGGAILDVSFCGVNETAIMKFCTP